MTTSKTAETIRGLIAQCEIEARRAGSWAVQRYNRDTGETETVETPWQATAADLGWVCERLGCKPSRSEWAAAGYPEVGGAHVGDPEECAERALARAILSDGPYVATEVES